MMQIFFFNLECKRQLSFSDIPLDLFKGATLLDLAFSRSERWLWAEPFLWKQDQNLCLLFSYTLEVLGPLNFLCRWPWAYIQGLHSSSLSVLLRIYFPDNISFLPSKGVCVYKWTLCGRTAMDCWLWCPCTCTQGPLVQDWSGVEKKVEQEQ